MPKLPRDMRGTELAKRLARFGYHMARQTGSHLRLERITPNGRQLITIPAHDPLKISTLNAILMELASQLKLSKEELLAILSE